MTNVEFVSARVPYVEVLAQLAEESAELGKAALKLRRVIDGTNPTPVTLLKACKNMVEEIADVLLCLEVMGFDPVEFRPGMDAKLQRWVDRLNEAERRMDQ